MVFRSNIYWLNKISYNVNSKYEVLKIDLNDQENSFRYSINNYFPKNMHLVILHSQEISKKRSERSQLKQYG